MDRQALSQALNKVIAYKNCNKPEQAQEWALKLWRMLNESGLQTK